MEHANVSNRNGVLKNKSDSHESKTPSHKEDEINFLDIRRGDLAPLFSGFSKITSQELPFAVTKFVVFDITAKTLIVVIKSVNQDFSEHIEVGVGFTGLAVSAFSGAIAGVFAAFVSHPADLVLTLSSAASKKESGDKSGNKEMKNEDPSDWRFILKELLAKDGGVRNLYAGFPARASFFFLVIGLQFFLYDYVKTLLNVGSDDLTLVLDVFYAIRQGLP